MGGATKERANEGEGCAQPTAASRCTALRCALWLERTDVLIRYYNLQNQNPFTLVDESYDVNTTYVPPDLVVDAVVPAIPEGPIGAVTPAVATHVPIAAAPAVLPFTGGCGVLGGRWRMAEPNRLAHTRH